MRSLLPSLIAGSLLLASSTAWADDAPSAAPQAPTPTHWYGYQTLAVDGAALAVLLPSFAVTDPRASTALAFGSGATFLVGGPVVHWAHGADLKGFADLGIRVGLPLALGTIGGFIGRATWHPTPCPTMTTDSCGGPGPYAASFQGAAIGGFIGVAGAIALDAAVLAREPLRRPGEDDDPHAMDPLASRTSTPARVEPTFHVAPERTGGARATVGLIGIF